MQWIEHFDGSDLPAAPEERIQRLNHLAGRELAGSADALPVVSASALLDMRRHLYADLKHERMGLLLGRAFYAGAWRRILVEVEIALPVHSVRASREHVSMLEESWPQVWREMATHPELQLVGWFHSHPGHGVFLSAEDKKTQKRWFRQPWQVAIVMDPVHDAYGFFARETGDPVEAIVL
jgi:proteasome lid subunit RPN8/RPN11